jgi:heme exporter protein C
VTTQIARASRGEPPAAEAEAPTSTGSRGTRILGLLTLVAIAVLGLFALVLSPEDSNQGNAVRIMYVHVPSATFAYVGCGLATLGSIMYLWRKSQWWDLVAYASAEIGAVMTATTLVTGMLWGRPTWGVYWVWDARLTSTAMLLLLLLGYLAVHRLPAEYSVRAKRASIVGLLLVPNVIIVRESVNWWRTLHQQPTLFSNGLGSKIEGLMLFSLFLGFVAIGLLFVWLLIHRFRLAWLEEQIEAEGIDVAIAERRAEAGGVAPGEVAP